VKWTIEHGMSVRRFGSGPELVWIHGLGESSTSFEPAAAELSEFSHVLVDLPGYGRSAWPDEPMGLDALADHLAAWLGEPRFVIGHSMGGVLATMIAERGRAKAIVNIDGNISRGDCTFSGQAIAWSEADFVEHGFAELRAKVYAEGNDEAALRGYVAAMTFASPRMFYRHASDLVALSRTESMAPRLAALAVPALFIAGVPRGICEPSRALLDRARARWIGIEPAGHWVYLDQRTRFAAAIRELHASTLSSRG
jgi:pimeloyl-ACP methyl ester carboxylesterase